LKQDQSVSETILLDLLDAFTELLWGSRPQTAVYAVRTQRLMATLMYRARGMPKGMP
jgi:hypothetical protein